MLTDFNKLQTVWKDYKGWGSTRPERETFEELYRSYQEVTTDSLLAYGGILPRREVDPFYNEIKSLDSTNPIFYFKESSFNTVPLVKKHFDCVVTPISPNCNDAFVILDKNGNQIRNIIPFDFSTTGLYNYTLKTSTGVEIPWGSCDWIVDTNSSILTFNNGVPQGVSVSNPPVLSFYQYVGPIGERHYIDAILLDVENVEFLDKIPVLDITESTKKVLDKIDFNFFDTYKFNGDDTTQGIGLQYNVLTSVTDSKSGDILKGFADNSQAQVVSLLSRKTGTLNNPGEILFVSEGVQPGTYPIQVEPDPTEISTITKIDLDNGFVVVSAQAGVYEVTVSVSEALKAVLLVKDNQTQDFELYYPRGNTTITVKVPVFVDMIKLPPHLKLTTLASYTDHIVPQYYGPRVVDFVIAAEDTENNKSADFITYDREHFYLTDAIKQIEGQHCLLRNGNYKAVNPVKLTRSLHFQGESKDNVVISNTTFEIDQPVVIENITFKDCTITLKNKSTLKNCEFIDTVVNLENENNPVVVKSCNFFDLQTTGLVFIDHSTIQKLKTTGSISLYNVILPGVCESTGKLETYGSYIQTLNITSGLISINASRIDELDCIDADKESVINTTAIRYVKNIPEFIKLDTSYVTQFAPTIPRQIYPDESTIPYYLNFEKRVYVRLLDPFQYDEQTNRLNLKLDSEKHTIFINDKGELQCRFFSGKEIFIDEPNLIKTQIEDKYQEHADTVLSTPKPQNIESAIQDLYWSKADLKNGKVPIDQLPDSVAAGGLSYVGMWSFEEHDGEYPTFVDVDFSILSDDKYTDLQRGWFFIVKASHKEDDPCYPQIAKDGVEFTAGDWIVYSGKPVGTKLSNLKVIPILKLDPVQNEKHTLLQYLENSRLTAAWSSCQQYAINKKVGLTTVVFFKERADIYKSTDTGFHFVESFPVEYIEGIFDKITPDIEPYRTVLKIKIGEYTFDVNGTGVRNDNSSYDVLDTQYFYKEDIQNNPRYTFRLLLKASDEKSQEWAETTFNSTKRGFALRPTSITGWWKDNHFDSNDVLDNIDVDYVFVAHGIAKNSFEMINSWEKVDRAYLDPVYSRLPEFATKTGGDNPQWSIEDGGTGLLRLSHKSLAEALRLINEELLKLSPARATSIQTIKTVIDHDRTTAIEREFIPVATGLQLNQLVKLKPEKAWDSNSGTVYFKQSGNRDFLPLETCFYCGTSSNIQVLDDNENITDSCTISRFDPYEKYRLGFKTPTTQTAAEVTGSITLGKQNVEKTHKVYCTQYNLIKHPHITEPVDVLEGESQPLIFSERKFYTNGSGVEIKSCESNSLNLRVLNNLLETHRTGGYGYLPVGTAITGEVIIENFTRYGSITTNAQVLLTSTFNDIELPIEITSQTFELTEPVTESYKLHIRFVTKLPQNIDYLKGNLIVQAQAENFDWNTGYQTVLQLKDLIIIKQIPEIVESSSIVQPTYGKKPENFGSKYKTKTYNAVCVNPELVFGSKGFSWPEYVEYVEQVDVNNTYVQTNNEGTDIGGQLYRFITFKHSFENVVDLCGFNVHIDWDSEKPELDPLTGIYKDVILQVCVREPSSDHIDLQNGNKPVPLFYETTFSTDEPCNYPGKSTVDCRRITFGRKPIQVQDIYIRIGLPKGLLGIKNITITED